MARARLSRAEAEGVELAADLARFTLGAWHLVCPQPMVVELPQVAILRHLQAALEGHLSDTLVINVPPAQSKSLLTSVIFPAFLWARDPSKTVIAVSHTAALVMRFAAKFRLLVESDWYKARWPKTRLSRDTTAKLSMRSTALGERIGVSVGGSITGSHADIIVVDDLLDASDAGNTAAVVAANEWHEGVLMTRWKSEEPGTHLEVCIAQRLHTNDLPAVLMARGACALILPAEGPGPDTPVWHDPRLPTELLAPVRLPRSALAKKRAQLGSTAYAAQYDQRPVPAEGGLVKAPWLAHEYAPGELPPGRTFVVADTSHGQTDPTGILAVRRAGARLYALDYLTGLWDFPAQVATLRAVIARHNPDAVYVEAAASGHSVVQTLRQTLPYVVGVPPHGPKEVRLVAITPMLEAGSFVLPSGAGWVRDFRAEVLSFPHALHDECVDVLSLACSKLLTPPGLSSVTEAGVSAVIEAMQ